MKHRNILTALAVLLCMTFGTAWAADTQEKKVRIGFTIQNKQEKSVRIGFKLIHNYTINYDLNGGTNNADNPASYTIESPDITLNNPTKTGYDFAGWTGTSLDVPTPNVTIAKGSTGAKSYVANWRPTAYTITYNLNNGTVRGNQPNYDIETPTFTLNNPTKNGYTFDGWTGTGLDGKTQTVTIEQGSTGDKTFTANFTPISYTITYNLDGGTNNSDNPANYTIENDTITLKAPTKDGYDFVSWTPDGVINSGSTGDKTFTAAWKEIETTPDAPDVSVPVLICPTDKITLKRGGTVAALTVRSSGDVAVDEWLTDGVLPKDLTTEKDANKLVIKGTVAAEAETGGYVYTVSAKNEAGTSNLITMTINVSADVVTSDHVEIPAGEISQAKSEDIKETFGTETNIVLTGTTTTEDLAETIKKLEEFTEVKTLDLSFVTDATELKLENTKLESITLENNQSITNVEVKNSGTLTELNLSGSSVKTVDAKGCEKLETVSVEKSESLQKLDVSETAVTKLSVKDCGNLETLSAKNCENLEEVNLEGCESLKTLDISETNVSELNAQDCKKLETLNCSSCDISSLKVDGCEQLQVIDCSSNSLTRFDASSFRKLTNLKCGNQHLRGMRRTRTFNTLDLLFNFSRLMNVSTADENETDTGDVANVKDIQAFDENGNEIPVTFNDETGEVNFSKEPAEIKYNYITGFNDIKMDVTVSTVEGDNTAVNGSGGGCELVRSEELGSRKYLITMLFALGLALLKKQEFKKI